jgi:hypothetical protein
MTFDLDQSVISHDSTLAQEDTLRPEVSEWGLTGYHDQGGPFTAWANVSDNDSGVKNVTLVIDPFQDYHPMNRAITFARTIDLTIGNFTPIDQNVTMPVVVGSSLALMAIAISLAYVYDKRQKTNIVSSVSEDDARVSTE